MESKITDFNDLPKSIRIEKVLARPDAAVTMIENQAMIIKVLQEQIGIKDKLIMELRNIIVK